MLKGAIKKEFYSIDDSEYGKIYGFHIHFKNEYDSQIIFRYFNKKVEDIFVYPKSEEKGYIGFIDIPMSWEFSTAKEFKKYFNKIYKEFKLELK